ncbi:hypothetical protein ACFL2V_01640 [Pseudomonadota bacterium]
MKYLLTAASFFLSSTAFAVDGYQDIYLDREKDIYIHGIVCGDFNNERSLKPSAVYSNASSIEKGTYYYSSKWGNYSYTFNFIEGKPKQLMIRGLLKEGQTDKAQMVVDTCLVDKLDGLPAKITRNLDQQILSPDDAEWDKTMAQYAMIAGRPAFAKGSYEDSRTANQYAAYDQKVYEANQAYLRAAEKKFGDEFHRMSQALPKKVEDAIAYAHQENGFLANKTYPVIKEPAVWTPTSERRYKDQVSRVEQEKAWDVEIQKNFDWFFGLVGKENKLVDTQVGSASEAKWQDSVLEQRATVLATFNNGKTLALDFIIKSSKLDSDVFDTLPMIKEKSNNKRQSIAMGSKKARKLVDSTNGSKISVYSPTEKVHLFFSAFKGKSIGQGYRYQ